MGSCEVSWKPGSPGSLKLAEHEKSTVTSSSRTSTPSPTLVHYPDITTISDDDDDIFIIETSGEGQENSLDVEGDKESETVNDEDDDICIIEEVGLDLDDDDLVSEEKEDSGSSASEGDNDWNVITISDDDDDDGHTQNTTYKERTCFRCPGKTKGKFKDEKLFFAHIKRHVVPDIFACPICKRSFLKFSHCLSHEIRVHGTPLECSISAIKDTSAIVKAKQYLKMKNRKDKPTCGSSRSEKIGVKKMGDENLDPEDITFYDNHFIKSSTIYPYRGPPVTNIIQCYEIQILNPKGKEVRSKIALKAIQIHKENVEAEKVTNKLGSFVQKKVRRKKVPVIAATKKRIRRKAPRQAPENPRVGERKRPGGKSSSPQPVCKKLRDDDDATESEEKN